LSAAARGPLPAEAVGAVWREILSACRVLEGPLTVAYLAPQGTFTHQAARERFGDAVDYHPSRTIAAIFDDVERGRVHFGVVPVENSTEGAVSVTLDRLVDTDVQICGELTLEIAQHLLSRAATLSRSSTSFSDVLIQLGTTEGDRVLARVKKAAVIANFALVGLFASVATFMGVASMTVPGTFASLMEPSNLMALRAVYDAKHPTH